MIASVRGKILRLELGLVVIETASGIGYEILIPFPTHSQLKSQPANGEVLLHTYHSITDRSQKLFGFLTPKDRDLFRLMKSLNGIGELTALKILSFFNGDALYQIATQERKEDLEKIPKVKGKTSEKVLFELRQNLKKLESFLAQGNETSTLNSDSSGQPQEWDLAVLGLIQLGFDEKSAKKEVELRWKKNLTDASDIISDVLRSLK